MTGRGEDHLSHEQVAAVAAGGAATAEVARHLEGCAACRRDVDLAAALDGAAALSAVEGCPDALALARTSEGELGPLERAGLAAHAAACPHCAEELEALSRMDALGPAPAPWNGPATGPSLADRLRAIVGFELPTSLAVTVRGDTAEAPWARAMDHYRAGRLDEALSGLRAAASDDMPEDVRFHLGACLVEAGEVEAGITELERCVRGDPGTTEYRWVLGQALALAGRGDEAAEQLDRVGRKSGPRRRAARDLARAIRREL